MHLLHWNSLKLSVVGNGKVISRRCDYIAVSWNGFHACMSICGMYSRIILLFKNCFQELDQFHIPHWLQIF